MVKRDSKIIISRRKSKSVTNNYCLFSTGWHEFNVSRDSKIVHPLGISTEYKFRKFSQRKISRTFSRRWHSQSDEADDVKESRCQFHKHFMQAFCAVIFEPKNFKPKTQICNFWLQNIGAKCTCKMSMKSTLGKMIIIFILRPTVYLHIPR